MVAAFRSELLKLRKRPAMWVLTAVMAVLVSLMGYILYYFVYLTIAAGKVSVGIPAGQYLGQLLPQSLNKAPIGFVTFGDYAIGIVLGALVAGSEYEWATTKTVFTQTPPRMRIYVGKLLATALVVTALVIVIFLVSAICSLALSLVAQSPPTGINWPSFGAVLSSIGTEWLILAMWASMGMMFAILFRSAALGVGVSVGEWLLEQLVTNQGARLSDAVANISHFLPQVNYAALSTAASGPVHSFVTPPLNISAEHAALVLAAYIVGFSVIGAAVLRYRDVL